MHLQEFFNMNLFFFIWLLEILAPKSLFPQTYFGVLRLFCPVVVSVHVVVKILVL